MMHNLTVHVLSLQQLKYCFKYTVSMQVDK